MPTPLLRTKLSIPRPRPTLVHRPRLLQRLDEALRLGHRLVLISAPAGSGKTTLISSWLAASGLPAAWLSLDSGDNEPGRFLTYLAAALQTLDPQVGEGIGAALQTPEPPSMEALLTALVNQIGESDVLGGAIVVLDDYHVVQTRRVHGALAFLLDHLPSPPDGPILILATRADPPFPISRLRGRGVLTEVRVADLRFTLDEAGAFLSEAMGLDIPAEVIAELERRTEGWVTGLQLAALSLRGRDTEQAADFVSAFAGSHRHILDYLIEEVLSNQPEPTQKFLLETAILDRMTASLCDQVTASTDSQSTLEMLEYRNVFILPLDEKREWFHYHRLFRDLLRARTSQMGPLLGCAPTPELHRRASAWFEANGMLNEAIDHANQAGDPERAADLVEANGLHMLTQGELATLLAWLSALPPDAFEARPWLAIYAAWAYGLTGQAEEAETKLRMAEATSPPTAADDRHGHIAAIRAYSTAHRRDLRSAVSLANRALSLLDEDNLVVRSVVTFTLGGALLAQGQWDAATEALERAMDMGRAGGNTHLAVSAAAQLAGLAQERGRLHEAFENCQRMLAMAEQSPVAAQAHSGIGELLYEWNDLDAAAEHLSLSIELGKRWGNAEALSGSYLWQARLRRAQGDLPGMQESLDRAAQLVQAGQHGDACVLVSAVRAWADISRGDLAAAERWVDSRCLRADATDMALREGEYLVLARLLVARGELDPAEGLLTHIRRSADRVGRRGLWIQALALQAVVQESQDDHAQALSSLERAVAAAEPEGYVRTFVDEGEAMHRLLGRMQPYLGRRVAAGGRSWRLLAYVRRVLAAFEHSDPVVPTATDQSGLAEPLTERELEVMRLVAAGLTNREIADQLYIAVSTVKSHTNAIYGKLGVRSRTQAVAAARDVGLL